MVGFGWCEIGGDDGDFYGLFLEEWDVEGFVEYVFEFFGGVIDLFCVGVVV